VRWEGGRFRCQVAGRSPAGALTLTLPVPLADVHEALVDGEPTRVSGLEVFGWPSTLIRVELDATQDRTRQVTVALHS
jgi:hypothetical protein